MSSKYAAQFAILSVGAIVAAIYADAGVARRYVFIWFAVAFAVVATAYGLGNPRLMMKRENGSQPVWSWIVLWPYFALAYASFWLHRTLKPRNVGMAEIAPGLWFARRPSKSEAHANVSRWSGVLDLTAEFGKAPVETEAYRCLPLLDGTAPTEAQLRDGAAWISERLQYGPVLVHCALGHGRTGCMVITWLMLNGHVGSVDDGISKLRALRSGVGLSRGQVSCVSNATADPAATQHG